MYKVRFFNKLNDEEWIDITQTLLSKDTYDKKGLFTMLGIIITHTDEYDKIVIDVIRDEE